MTVQSKYSRIQAVITSIERDTDWDIAENDEKLYFYQLRAAQNVNIFEPFTDEQASLIDYLSQRRAGRRLNLTLKTHLSLL
jgi:hypothetical protein